AGGGLEVFLAQPQHLVQPRIVGAQRRIVGRGGELPIEHRAEWMVAALCESGCQPVVAEAAVLLLLNERRVFQQAQMARYARLRQAKDPRQLRDVEPLTRQYPQQAQPPFVAEKPVPTG